MTFGENFKAARLRLGKTLLEFCIENRFNPSTVNRIERNRMVPPRRVTLNKYAVVLDLSEVELRQFFGLAEIGRGRIPADLLSDAELMGKLPAILCAMQGKRLDGPGLDRLIEMIREA